MFFRLLEYALHCVKYAKKRVLRSVIQNYLSQKCLGIFKPLLGNCHTKEIVTKKIKIFVKVYTFSLITFIIKYFTENKVDKRFVAFVSIPNID